MSQNFINQMKATSIIYYSSCFSPETMAEPQTVEWSGCRIKL